MPNHKELLSDLQEIISLIEENRITGDNEALQKFEVYLDSIQVIGSYSPNNWPEDWRNLVYTFGRLFTKLTPLDFFKIIDIKLHKDTKISTETTEFIHSEIAINSLPTNDAKKTLEKLKEKYPLNPEFKNTLAQFYMRENKYLAAIDEYKLAMKFEPRNEVFLQGRFNVEYEYLNSLILEGKLQQGKDHVTAIFKEKFYDTNDVVYHNVFVSFFSRLEDHMVFQNKLLQLEKDFKDKMNSELDKEKKRMVEILGFFSAIIAFILTTVSISKNFQFIQAIFFIIGLGIILILFAVALSTLFTTTKTDLRKDSKFWILISSLVALLIFIIILSFFHQALNVLSF